MDQKLELHLQELEKDEFRKLLAKLDIAVKAADTETTEKAARYALYKAELQKKFEEEDINITTVADLEKLEKAATLAEFKTEIATLKNSANVSTTGDEAIEHTADLETIKTNIADMKTKAAALKTEIDAYKTAKATMTADEITAKDLDIKTQKAAIEELRKTTQALIDTIRKAMKEVDYA